MSTANISLWKCVAVVSAKEQSDIYSSIQHRNSHISPVTWGQLEYIIRHFNVLAFCACGVTLLTGKLYQNKSNDLGPFSPSRKPKAVSVCVCVCVRYSNLIYFYHFHLLAFHGLILFDGFRVERYFRQFMGVDYGFWQRATHHRVGSDRIGSENLP